jgi:hypothetical protein
MTTGVFRLDWSTHPGYWTRPPVPLTKAPSGGTVFDQSVLATTAPVAALTRQTGKIVQASTSPAASLIRLTGKIVQASSAPIASLVRQTAKIVAATTAPLATLGAVRQFLVALQATTAPLASLVRQTGKIVAATTAPASSLTRLTGKAVRASTAPLASLSRQTAKILRASAGAIAGLSALFQAGLALAIDPNYLLAAAARVRGAWAGLSRSLNARRAERGLDADGRTRGFIMPPKDVDE